MKVKTGFHIFCLFLLILFRFDAHAGVESYVVVFEERYYQEDGQLYRAEVTVYKSGKKLKTHGEIRGSTLPNRFLYYMDKNRPIIAPGEYAFDIKNSRKFSKALILNNGGYTETVNPNPTQYNRYMANGIWVHKGRNKGPVKGSKGCLTIDSKNWDEFINLFPSAEDWKKRHCRGKIIITRNSDRPIKPGIPSDFRFN